MEEAGALGRSAAPECFPDRAARPPPS